jgi:hypothetical protein
MCFAPKPPKVPPPVQYQPTQTPKDMMQDPRSGASKLHRRGMFASVFTSPQGIAGPPRVTGTAGGATGG